MQMEQPIHIRRSALLCSIAEGQGRLGSEGRQKVVVTSLNEHETPLADPRWVPVTTSGKRPVLTEENIEFGVFDHRAPQDRHYHHHATECYTTLDGTMKIEVAGTVYELPAGDTLIIPPPLAHEVLRTSSFLAQVFVANCKGTIDKFVANA